jgi:hypothetical protein
MKQIALLGAGGKMGLRLTDNLLQSADPLRKRSRRHRYPPSHSCLS